MPENRKKAPKETKDNTKRTKTKKTPAKKSKTRKNTTTQKKRAKRKTRKKNTNSHKNLLSILIGLLSVCIILISVYMFIIPAVKTEEKAQTSTKSERQAAKIESKKETTVEKTEETPKTPKKNKKIIPKKQESNTENLIQPKKLAKAKKTNADTKKKKVDQEPPIGKKELTQKTKKEEKQESKSNTQGQKKERHPEPVAMLQKNELAPPIPELPPLPSKGSLVFVFDDAGHNLEQLEYFLRLPFPCAIAVLPKLPNSKEAARRIRASGKEAMLHQPMQAINMDINPGDGAIKPGMSEEDIKAILISNIEEIWPIAGMNNHEGSLITADEFSMRIVLKVCKEKNIFFLDSRTSAKTVVPKIAKELNFPISERTIFIDNDKNIKAMEKQIINGLSIAEKKGSAIMIGHVFTVELAKLLEKMYPQLEENGYSFETISTLTDKNN